MNRFVLTISALLLLFSACKKEDSTTTIEEDLRSGVWRRTSGTITYKDSLTRGDSTMDYIRPQDTCRKDNSLVFKEFGNGTMNLGVLRCTPGEPDSKAFSWQVTADGLHLSLYGVADYFPTANVDANIITRTLGYLTIRYRVIRINTSFQTADTVYYTDVLRR